MTSRLPRSLPAAALVAFAAACPHALAQSPASAPQAALQSPPGAPAACAPPPPQGTVAAALCADPAARAADRRRAQAYDVLRHQLHPAQRPGLDADALAFRAFLEAQCRPGGAPDAACIARAATAKRDDLLRWLQPPAREEAERDPDAQAALESRLPATEGRRDAIAALQRAAGLPATGFLDTRTATLLPPPATPTPALATTPATPAAAASAPIPPPALTSAESPTAPPAGATWLPRFPVVLGARYAVTACNAPTVSWVGGGLYLGSRPVPGETGYTIFADEQRFYLFPASGGPARIVEGQPDGGMRLSGVIPAALATRGVAPGATLRRCPDPPVRVELARPSSRR